MNAHIDFLTRDANALNDTFTPERRVRHWLHSASFKVGLCEGFGAPVLVFRRFEYPRASGIDSSVSGAWKIVGNALKEATTSEGARIGKVTRKGKQVRQSIAAG